MSAQLVPSTGGDEGHPDAFFAGSAQSQSVPQGSISVQEQHALPATHCACTIAQVTPIVAPFGHGTLEPPAELELELELEAVDDDSSPLPQLATTAIAVARTDPEASQEEHRTKAFMAQRNTYSRRAQLGRSGSTGEGREPLPAQMTGQAGK